MHLLTEVNISLPEVLCLNYVTIHRKLPLDWLFTILRLSRDMWLDQDNPFE